MTALDAFHPAVRTWFQRRFRAPTEAQARGWPHIVAGFFGEQYARPEAVDALRRVRRAEKRGELVQVSAVDPLNLVGILTPGPRVPAVHTNVVVYRDGLPLPPEQVEAPLGPWTVLGSFSRRRWCNATGDGRPGPYGREHGEAAAPRRPRGHRLRP